MAERSSTYVAFHANPARERVEPEIHYHNLLKVWRVREDNDFSFTNAHEKAAAIRDVRLRTGTERLLRARLQGARNMILIVGQTTREDNDWIPLEVRYAVDDCGIPIIAAYLGFEHILDPASLEPLWPAALAKRIRELTARVIHIPFREEPLRDAANQFDHAKPPRGPLSFYNQETYAEWGHV
ncbi:MAG: hypothetical protein KJ025_15540 [Burkholderiales bacterium]|nr:hypothetical protein [Burkholderiales bacterium]